MVKLLSGLADSPAVNYDIGICGREGRSSEPTLRGSRAGAHRTRDLRAVGDPTTREGMRLCSTARCAPPPRFGTM